MEKDIIKGVIVGYKASWKEKAYLVKLAVVPLVVKIICTVITYNLQVDMFSPTFFLVMLPSFVADAWFVALVLRLFLLNERKPYNFSNDSDKEHRVRAVKSTVLYTTLMMLVQGSVFVIPKYIMDVTGLEPITKDWQPSLIEFFAYVGLFVAIIWAFRFLWMSMPLSINASMRDFLKDISGYSTSLYMIGVWAISVVPVMMLLVLLPATQLDPSYETIYDLPLVTAILIVGLRILSEIIGLIVVTVSMCYVFSDVLKKYGAKPIFN